ncbi:GMC family oxidoreductase [Gammaproteobacteria bacterium]|nr:GMC family oxidoreductase [Gammaproteobacteria bacterium]
MRVAIVGSGPGGMITAKELTDAGIEITLFERGSFCSQKDGPTPYGVDEMDVRYVDRGVTIAFGKPNVNYVEGCCLGGGSEVNAGLYQRTPEDVLRVWRNKFGLISAHNKELDPHFEACEKLINVCNMPFSPPIASEKIRLGASKLGWQCKEAPRWYKYLTKEDKGVYSGIRQSMTEAVLPRINVRKIDIRIETVVTKITETNSGQVILHAKELGGLKEYDDSFDAVFISGGAIGTADLLKRSGIGVKHVGSNLRLHPSIRATARFEEVVNGPSSGIPVHQVKEFMPHFSIGGSISNLAYLSAGLSDNDVNPLELLGNWNHYSTYYAAVGEGVGRVSSLPTINRPFVRFDLGKKGLRVLAEGLRAMCELLFAAGAKEVFPSIRGYGSLKNESDIGLLPKSLDPRNVALMTIHLMGSCAMGSHDEACVDIDGRLRGYRNIYVADASIIPTALGVNPQGTIMAFTRMNAITFCREALDG